MRLEITSQEEVLLIKGTVKLPAAEMVVYAFLTDGMLVDTGPRSLLKALADFYKEQQFELVALTHYHEDHTGTASWIQETKQVPIYLNPLSISLCSEAGSYPQYRQVVWGIREGFTALPMQDTLASKKYTWEVLATPGHSSDHLVFLNKDTGVLFTGDLYITSNPKVILAEESVPQAMDSLRKVLDHDFQHVFCCHAGYVPHGKRALNEKLEYLENLTGEILSLHHQGCEIPEIRSKLFPNTSPISYFSGGEFASEHLVRSVVSEMT